jgi:thioredoxin 1
MPQPLKLALAVVCAAAGGARADPPPVFADLGFTEAMAAAKEKGVLLIVDATAEWCGPCKMMDRTTWIDDGVEEWLGANAIAIQVDVDAETDVARELEIGAMPTVVAFRDGKELDRHVGYQDASEILAWLGAVKEGRTSLDLLREKAGDRADPAGRVDVRARMDLAEKLAQRRAFEEATEEYLWLWEHMLEFDPAMAGVRGSFMASDMGELAKASEHARAAFAAVRNETEQRLRSDPAWEDLHDWIVLNEVIGDQDATLAWIDRNKGDEDGRRTLRRYDYRILPLLQERGRLADYGLIIADPERELRKEHARLEMLRRSIAERAGPEDGMKELAREFEERFFESAANIHAGLLAAGREEDAWRAVEVSLELADAPELRRAIVRRALEAGQARERHRNLLGESADSELGRELEEALGG